MKNLSKKITAFLTDEQGAETVEWVIVVALVAGIGVAALSGEGGLATAIKGGITSITGALDKV